MRGILFFLVLVEFSEILQGASTLMIASFKTATAVFILNTKLHTNVKARLKSRYEIGCYIDKYTVMTAVVTLAG